MAANPYQPIASENSSSNDNEQSSVRTLPWGMVIGIGYPLFLLLMFHLLWLLAAFSLGHPPRPNLDDPKNVAFMPLYYFVGGLLIAFPAFVGLAMTLDCAGVGRAVSRSPSLFERLCGTWFRVIFILAFAGATVAYLRWDPTRMVEWYFD